MDTFGFPMYPPALLLMALMAIGYSLMPDGHGSLITHGDGRHFTTVAGTRTLTTDPCGFPETNGVLLGLPGEAQQGITDGRQ